MSSTNLLESINNLLQNEVIDRHSLFQCRYFIIGKEPTNQSKMWRCLTELKARKETIESIKMEIENTEDNIKLLELDIKSSNWSGWAGDPQELENSMARVEIEKRKLNRKLDATKKSKLGLERKLKFVEEEAEFFVGAFQAISAIEPLKPYDDYKSQEEYWSLKLSQEVELKLLLRQPLDTELVKSVLALNDKNTIKQEMVQLLKKLDGPNQEQKVITEANAENIQS
jgi:hypothetical protein